MGVNSFYDTKKERDDLRIKKCIYHVVLFILPTLILLGIWELMARNQIEYSAPPHLRFLSYYTVLNLISFVFMYFAHKLLGAIAYIVPAGLFLGVLPMLSKLDDSIILSALIYLPLFISSFVHTTGFIVYQKWIDKSN